MAYRNKNIMSRMGNQLLIFCLVFFNIFCNNQDDSGLHPDSVGYQKDTVVGLVSNIKVRNAPGKAIIKFTPPDSGALYVKAVYRLSNGEQRSVIANLYEDSLVLEGFSDTKKHEIKVYSINRSGVISSPQIVVVQPEAAPLNRVFNSLKVDNYFGGYRLTAENVFEDVIGIIVIQKGGSGSYTNEGDKSVYSSQDSIVSVVNDLDPANTYQFGFYVIDQYGNTSDTMFKEINPIKESQIDRSSWNIVDVDDVQSGYGGEGLVAHLIDGDPNTYWLTTWEFPVPHPHYVAIDMEEEQLISGFKIVARRDQLKGNPKNVTFMLSNDGEHWEFKESFVLPFNNSDGDLLETTVHLSNAVNARYFKFVVDKSVENTDFTHVSEVYALGK